MNIKAYPFFKILFTVIFFILLFFLWRNIAPFFLKMPQDFFYRANLLSLDNFYNNSTNEFEGENASITNFFYKINEVNGNTAIVDAVFDVRTIDGDPVFSVSRQYGIDRTSWQHTEIAGDRKREGHLFAPRRLAEGDSYIYWHVSYDAPIEMSYQETEYIEGVRLYKYRGTVLVDATPGYSHLEGVPEEKGVKTESEIYLWIEPMTGRMINHTDSGVSFYFDYDTGERLSTINKYENKVEYPSVKEQLSIVKPLVLKVVWLEIVIPLLIILIGLIAVLLQIQLYAQGKKRHFWQFGIVIFIALVLVHASLFLYSFLISTTSENKEIVKVGVAAFLSETSSIDSINGFKEGLKSYGYQEGKDIEYVIRSSQGDLETHRGLLREFSQLDLDLVFSLTTVGTLVAKEEISNIPIIFSNVTYPVEDGLVASLKNSGNNLTGARIWVSSKTQLATFHAIVPDAVNIAFLRREGEPNSTTQLAEFEEAAKLFDKNLIDIPAENIDELLSKLLNKRNQYDAIYSSCDTLVQSEKQVLAAFATRYKVPDFTCGRGGAESGILVATSFDSFAQSKISGEKAALVLGGATPSSLEISSIARPLIYINDTKAIELGISVPKTIQLKAKRIFD